MRRVGDWIQTFSGIKFYPFDPKPEEIDIVDIAHALSMQCRFTGHVKKFYSVAEHSVRVSFLCKPENALYGLLHDASEAYLCDVARPVKHMEAMKEYLKVEKIIMNAVCDKYHLDRKMPSDVKSADDTLCYSEARDLLGPLVPGWKNTVKLLDYKVIPWTQLEAENYFLERFCELVEKIKYE